MIHPKSNRMNQDWWEKWYGKESSSDTQSERKDWFNCGNKMKIDNSIDATILVANYDNGGDVELLSTKEINLDSWISNRTHTHTLKQTDRPKYKHKANWKLNFEAIGNKDNQRLLLTGGQRNVK